jgi:phosphoserine phosphatase
MLEFCLLRWRKRPKVVVIPRLPRSGCGFAQFQVYGPDAQSSAIAVPRKSVTILLLQATGQDHPGIIEKLTAALTGQRVRILDVGQAVIHRTLNLGFLVELDEADAVSAKLVAVGRELELDVRLSPVPTEEYEAWVARHREGRHIITLFGPCIQAEHLERLGRVTRTFGLNVAVVTRLSGRVSLANPCAENNACIELGVRGTPSDPVAMRRELLAIANELQCDIGFQEDNVWRRNRRMIAFDMDSTLIQAEVIDELARAYGVVDQVSKITEAAMNGELDFDQSLRRRLSLLKGLRTDVMDSIAHNLQLTPGAERLIRTVRALGYKTAILSGGFTYFGHYIQRKLGIDYVHANELEVEDGKLTGNVIGPIVNGARKAQLLQELAIRENIVLDQVIAVGDGANDLPMLGIAGLGIAFHAKPRVRESAKQQISTAGLDGILYLIGVRDREVEPLSYTSHC